MVPVPVFYFVLFSVISSASSAVVRQYSCDNYFQSWCQLHNVTIQMEGDVASTIFPRERQLGFVYGTIGNFSHTFNNQLFRAGVVRVFARGTRIPYLTMPTTLDQLYLRDNDLRTVEIDPRVRYTLRYLRIQMNKIRSVARFEHLTQLLELNLCDNLLETVPFDTFATMTGLRQLILCGNHIKTLVPPIPQQTVVQLPALTHLDLSGNFIASLPLARWQFPQLVNLGLRDNLLTALDSGAIVARFPRMRIFDASANALDCRSYRQALRTFANRSIVHLIDRRMCSVDDAVLTGDEQERDDGQQRDGAKTIGNEIVPARPGSTMTDRAGQEIRNLKERLFLQQLTIQRQRMEIEQLRANLTTLMEQFDLVAGPVRAVDPF
uniref:Leucine rich immune protein (Short) n=1 Tax=Anopheles albimanus TaxID=7167 RepID=A0A182F832_ANOAL